jgi:hypothetical protein
LGGMGSGNRHRLDKKTTTSECNSLDVRRLYRDGLLKPGTSFSSSWSRADRETGSIGGFVFRDQLILSYSHRSRQGAEWETVKEPVPLEWTPCNFGGERPWFVCPGVVNGKRCGRRVAVLYGPGKYFLCRHCYDLRYESQREDKKDRALRRAQKIRIRLGGSANMMEPFPERPKGIHWSTYDRSFMTYEQANEKYTREMVADLERLTGRVFGRLGTELQRSRSLH